MVEGGCFAGQTNYLTPAALTAASSAFRCERLVLLLNQRCVGDDPCKEAGEIVITSTNEPLHHRPETGLAYSLYDAANESVVVYDQMTSILARSIFLQPEHAATRLRRWKALNGCLHHKSVHELGEFCPVTRPSSLSPSPS